MTVPFNVVFVSAQVAYGVNYPTRFAPACNLVNGKMYRVRAIDIRDDWTAVYLQGSDEVYNSVWFRDATQEEILAASVRLQRVKREPRHDGTSY